MTAKRWEVSVEPRVIEVLPTPPRAQLHDGLTNAVDVAMSRLLERQAEIIRMVVYEKLTFDQIGKHYGIERNSAHDRYTRAKEALRKELMKHDVIEELLNE